MPQQVSTQSYVSARRLARTVANTIGIVRVSRLSAAVTGVPCARITSGCRATNSLAKTDARLTLPPPQRISIRKLGPSAQPNAASSSVNAKSWAFPLGSPASAQHAERPHAVGLLRARRERPRERRAADERG